MHTAYRPDIDGLRAIAVLAVLFYHAHVPGISGGFVGVDVFFVISGFLITTILIKELARGTFSIAQFYERRIRRIFPALFGVMAFTLAAGFFLYGPVEFEAVGRSVAAATAFASNLLFANESGYFDGAAEQKPLLHTWSLAIEEQFYIGFPLLLWFIARYGRRRYTPWILAIVLLSFALNLYTVNRSPELAFYTVPMRAWELLVGGIIALGVLPVPRGQLVRGLVATAGLAAILFSVFAYTRQTTFPGIAALLPTLGAAALIYSGAQAHWWTPVLGSRPLVFVGLISYSLYLWHWPLLVYARHINIEPLDALAITGVLLMSFVTATLSWRYVEQPFRQPTLVETRATVFRLAAASIAVMLAAGVGVWQTKGLPARIRGGVASTAVDDAEWEKWGECEAQVRNLPTKGEPCKVGAVAHEASFFVWGDSHARALAPAIDASASRYGQSGAIATMNACPPLMGIERTNRRRCLAFNNGVLQYLEDHQELRTVILAARWAISAEGTLYKTESAPGPTLFTLVDMAARPQQSIDNAAGFKVGLERTIAELQRMHRNVLVVLPVPEVGYNVPAAVFVGERTGRNIEPIISPRRSEYSARNRIVLAEISALSASGIRVVDPTTALCDGERCQTVKDGRPLYRDDDHLSTLGAHYISTVFDPFFGGVRASADVAPAAGVAEAAAWNK